MKLFAKENNILYYEFNKNDQSNLIKFGNIINILFKYHRPFDSKNEKNNCCRFYN